MAMPQETMRMMVQITLWGGLAGVAMVSCVGDQPTTPPVDAGGSDTTIPEADSSVKDGGTDTSTAVDASDASNTSDAADAAPPWSPSMLSGLVLWLDGSKVIKNGSSKLVLWPDSSDAGNNATTFDGGAPVVFPTGLNGLPIIQFDGNVQSISVGDSPSLQFGVSDYAIVAVAAYKNPPSNNPTFGFGTIYAKSTLGNVGPSLIGNDPYNTTSQVYAQVAQNDGVRSGDAGYNDNKAHIFGVRRRGTTLDVLADTTVTSGTPTAKDVSAIGTPVYIGGVPPYYQALDGYVAELIAVKGSLSDPDLTNLRAYYKAKYALP